MDPCAGDSNHTHNWGFGFQALLKFVDIQVWNFILDIPLWTVSKFSYNFGELHKLWYLMFSSAACHYRPTCQCL